MDLSHFNINGRVFGAVGAPECSAEATVFHVKMETEIGRRNPIKLKAAGSAARNGKAGLAGVLRRRSHGRCAGCDR